MYEDATLNNVPLKLTLNKEPLEQALSVICSQAGMRYELVENNYVLILPIDRNAKRRTITGVIKDDTGEPVIGASIVIQGTTFGTVANMDGQFMLSYPENTKNDELMISFIGMQTVKEKIGNRHVFNIKMESEVTNLDEVVVVGYGTSSVKDLTGSVASVGLKQLSQLNTPNVTSMLQNLAAGVQVSQNTGVPGETVRVRVRGATSLTGSNEPLYVIDGVPVEDPSMLDAISPNDIQSMDVTERCFCGCYLWFSCRQRCYPGHYQKRQNRQTDHQLYRLNRYFGSNQNTGICSMHTNKLYTPTRLCATNWFPKETCNIMPKTNWNITRTTHTTGWMRHGNLPLSPAIR